MNGDNQKPGAGQPEGGQWQYTPTAQPQPANQMPAAMPMPTPQEVEWTASEFVAHNKTTSWYGMLALAAVVLAAIIYFVTKDLVSAGIIVLVAVLLGVSAARKPRVLHYQVNGGGLAIGEKFYPYAEFKSFSVMQEGAFSSIMFLPLKRFMPPISIYYDPQDEERIIDVLSFYLPMENRSHDVIDSLVKRIRF
jgi:hypothetical protein